MSTITPDDRFYDRVQPNRLSPKDERIKFLEKKLSSAFRKGLNVGVQGLHRIAPSDHLPIEATVFRAEGKPMHLLSWNMLSDTHLGNYYRNINLVDAVLNDPAIPAENKFKTRGHWLLFFMADHLRKTGRDTITLDKNTIRQFVEEYPFERGFSKKDAKEIVEHFLENGLEEPFMKSVQHAIEIHFSISEGYLRWENRLPLIKANKPLLKQIAKQDIICLQECTTPRDIFSLLPKKEYQIIHHAVQAGDNAVIVFNAEKYEVMKDENDLPLIKRFSLGNSSKPCILCTLKSRLDPEALPLVVGSIHHPGGDENELNHIQQQLEELQGKENYDVFILGDFNHLEDFFQKLPKKFSMMMPKDGTMAGPDYGSTNKPIDGLYTNRANKVALSVVQMPHAPPINLPLKITIRLY